MLLNTTVLVSAVIIALPLYKIAKNLDEIKLQLSWLRKGEKH